MNIVQKSLEQIANLQVEVSTVFDDLKSKTQPLREALLDTGIILKIPTESIDDTTVIAVDGGSVVQQLALGDLVSTGAVASEGAHPRLFKKPEDIPSMIEHTFFRDHSKSVTEAASVGMAFQEMVMMENSLLVDHTLKIIDGSWTSALVTFLKGILNVPVSAQTVNTYMDNMYERGEWDGEEIVQAIIRRMHPWGHYDYKNGHYTVAISKSDSQRSYAEFLKTIGIDDSILSTLSDRTISQIVLEPGEMLMPAGINMDNAMFARGSNVPMRRVDTIEGVRSLGKKTCKHEDQIRGIYERLIDLEVFSEEKTLVSPSLRRISDEFWLWSTYIKPEALGENARPIKLDFPRSESATFDGTMPSVLETAKETLNTIMSLLASEFFQGIKEPLPQHYADIYAKEVSSAARIVRQSIVQSSSESIVATSFMSNYRT